MNQISTSATSTMQRTLSYKLTTYFRQRWLYQTIIGDVKRHVKKEIAENLQMEEQERINKILDSTMRRVRGGEKLEEKKTNIEPNKKVESKRKAKEQQLQNGNGDYTVLGAAQYLGFGLSTVRKYQTDKKITGYMLGTKRFFTKEELDMLKVKEKTEEEVAQGVENSVMEQSKNT